MSCGCGSSLVVENLWLDSLDRMLPKKKEPNAVTKSNKSDIFSMLFATKERRLKLD